MTNTTNDIRSRAAEQFTNPSTEPAVSVAEKVKRAPRYAIIMLNDDTTPMDFVVVILMHVFDMNESEASYTMMRIHVEGSAVCGVYALQIAETKIAEVFAAAEKYNYPLQCALDREADEEDE